MSLRRFARERAVELLFQCEQAGSTLDMLRGPFWKTQKKASRKAKEFAEDLVSGVLDNQGEIDTLLQDHLQHWDLNRLNGVDRSILRMAIFEMLKKEDVPHPVAINEAVEIAKKFGGRDSFSFVNGVLDGVRRSLVGAEKS